MRSLITFYTKNIIRSYKDARENKSVNHTFCQKLLVLIYTMLYVTQNMLSLNSFIFFARVVKTKHSTIMVIVYIFDAFSSVSITLIFTCPYSLNRVVTCHKKKHIIYNCDEKWPLDVVRLKCYLLNLGILYKYFRMSLMY